MNTELKGLRRPDGLRHTESFAPNKLRRNGAFALFATLVVQASPASGTVHRYQYGYDLGGNRLYARVTQANDGVNPHINDRSSLYTYDQLNRLVDSSYGSLNGGDTAIIENPPMNQLVWTLDNLSNWTGDAGVPLPGLTRDEDSDRDGVLDVELEFTHAVDVANQILSVSRTDYGVDPAVGTNSDYVHDAAGNLIYDGQYFYQYDAFNRLLRVKGAGSLTPASFDADGHVLTGAPKGKSRAIFHYDGLGRLIQKRHRKVSGVQTAKPKVDYYYDGVRRIQEIDKVPDILTLPPVPGYSLEQDYVYGPGYVDEFVAQIDNDGDALYMLQDAEYNVVALTDAAGAVLVQYSYEPYGKVINVDEIAANQPISRVGHHGMFFDRFNSLLEDPPPLERDAKGLYHARNRSYSPLLGRFMQRDPNETGQLVLMVMAFNGSALSGSESDVDPQVTYADGMNLFVYVSSNPVNGFDPSGLDEIDDLIAELMGHALYVLGALNEGARWASLGLQTTLDIAGALLGLDVFESVNVLASGRGGFWSAMNIVASVNPIGRLGRVGGVLGKAFGFARRGARGGGAVLGAFKAFTRRHFRHNLKVLTRFDAPTSMHAHHMLPIKHAPDFKKARINIHDPKYGAWWGDWHLSNSNRYNRAWKDFFHNHRNPGPGQVESFGRQLAAEYGLLINF